MKDKVTICERCLKNLREYKKDEVPIIERANPNEVCIWCMSPNQPYMNRVYILKGWEKDIFKNILVGAEK